jgi:L-fuculose-phosphate aldolase
MQQTVEHYSEIKHREDLVTVCNLLYKKGLISGFDGNMSLKSDERTILITPLSTHKGFIRSEQFTKVDISGEFISGGKPSSELDIHLEIYKKRTDVNAIIHAHPPTLISLTVSGMNLDEPLIPDVINNLGSIPTVPYPGTDREKEKSLIASSLENHDAVILERHGAVTVGTNIYKALHYTELLEFAAKIMLNAKLTGEVLLLDELQIKDILNEREKSCGRNIDMKSELNDYSKHKNKFNVKKLFSKFFEGNSLVFQRILCLLNELNLSVISRTSYANKLTHPEKEQLSRELTTSFIGMILERFTGKKL